MVSENTTVSLPSFIKSISSAMVLSSSSPASTMIRSLPFIFSYEFFTPLELRLRAPIFNTERFILVSVFTSFKTSIAFSSAFCAVIPSTTIEPGLLIRNSLGSLCFGALAFITLPCTDKSVSFSSGTSSTLSSITTVSSSFCSLGSAIFSFITLFTSLGSDSAKGFIPSILATGLSVGSLCVSTSCVSTSLLPSSTILSSTSSTVTVGSSTSSTISAISGSTIISLGVSPFFTFVTKVLSSLV